MVKYSQGFVSQTLDCGLRLTRIKCSAPPKNLASMMRRAGEKVYPDPAFKLHRGRPTSATPRLRRAYGSVFRGLDLTFLREKKSRETVDGKVVAAVA